MFVNRKHSEETKEKMRKARLGRVNSPETRKKISKNHAKAWKGRKHTEETKKKIGEKSKKKVFTPEYRKKLGEAMLKSGHLKGEKNPNWKGGITPINLAERTSFEYKKWRKEVFERDNYTCVLCNDSSGGNLEADHVKPFSVYRHLRHDVNNGRTLCKSCHRKTDTWGYKAIKSTKKVSVV
jgi:hypothetical protein